MYIEYKCLECGKVFSADKEQLEYAKKATKTCLEDSNCNVDFHGLSYWAKEVKRLRNKIKENL